MNKVNLLLLPYNYVFSENIRKIMRFSLQDAIIVFDEAHNVESSSEQANSYKINLDELREALKIKS